MAVQVVRNTLPWCSPIHRHGGGGAEPEEGVCRYKRGEKRSRQAVEQTKKLKIGHNRHTSRPKVRERLRATRYHRRQVKQGVIWYLFCIFVLILISQWKNADYTCFVGSVIFVLFKLIWQTFCDYSLFLLHINICFIKSDCICPHSLCFSYGSAIILCDEANINVTRSLDNVLMISTAL